jgi:hypothetical protein
VVHVVAKTHLDLGFTALAAEVEREYLDDFFPRALAVAAALRSRSGPERLTWTTGAWILHRALHQRDGERVAALEEAVRAGDLAWHALPLTFHTELMDAALFRSALGFSRELDDRFGRTTSAAKMTDVPGHTRAMAPLLAEAGVSFLHLGVNPAWPVPEVPPVFRWRSPDGAEVTVAYQAGGYGGEVVVGGCEHALAFLHAGDNLGPPSVDDVVSAHAALAEQYPGAEVRASTLDAFARALAASGAVDALPVVTAEIGDPWLFGAASDPQKVAGFRRLLRVRAGDDPVDRTLVLVPEHTWGLDQKVALPGDVAWSAPELERLRGTEAGRRFEASWREQRAYVDAAGSQLGLAHESIWGATGAGGRPSWVDTGDGDGDGHLVVVPGDEVELAGWRLAIDPDTGAVVQLRHDRTGRVLAAPGHPLGLVTHQSFDEADYERFYAQLTPAPDDEWWARWDNTKPGVDACGARSGRWSPRPVRVVRLPAEAPGGPAVVVASCFSDDVVALGAPTIVWQRWTASVHGVELDVAWADKPATRLPEATWCSFTPVVAEPERWELDKLGQRVSPLDVVRRGGRSLHAVGEGMHYDGPDGPLTIATLDAPLVAPGAPNLLDADPPVPDLSGGFHVLLHDNCWGTNFPMWNEGAAAFRFRLALG